MLKKVHPTGRDFPKDTKGICFKVMRILQEFQKQLFPELPRFDEF